MRTVPALFFLLTLAGCRSGGFRGGSAENRGEPATLRLALATGITTLDPAKVQDAETGPLLKHVFETLVDYDEQSRIVPLLAKSFQVSADGRTVTFILNEAKFSSGRPVTAEDVRKSFVRALSPQIASPVASTYLGDIVGAKGGAPLGVETPDERTVIVRLVRPAGAFLGKLTYPAAAIVDTGACAGGEIIRSDQAIGSGPFRLARVQTDLDIRLERSENFRGPAASLSAIQYAVVRDASTRLNLFRKGSLDLLSLDRGQIPAARADTALAGQLKSLPRPAVYYLLFNAKAYPPFADVAVRRAFAMAIDRKRLATQVLGSLEPADRWVPPAILPGAPGSLPPFDPAGARQLLAGRRLPTLDLTVRADNPDSKAVAEAISADLKTNLGVEVRPAGLEWGALLRKRNNGQLAFAFLNWIADYADPENFLSFLLRTDSGVNFDHWSNAEFDALTERADAGSVAENRASLYLKAEGIVLRELPRLPLYFGQDQVLVSRRVRGLRSNALGLMPHFRTTVD